MKHILIPAFGVLCGLFALSRFASSGEQIEDREAPDEYFWAQRAFPFGHIPADAYYTALERARERGGMPLEWTLAGPSNIGGRITDVEIDPLNANLMYAAAASGGVWKSADAGTTWMPIADALPSQSIGDLALPPSQTGTLYCGTGEANGGGGSVAYGGRGVFKTTDGGAHWQSLGLEQSGGIGRMAVDPLRPDRVFVAAMGQLFGNNSERGVFRSLDGGLHWQKTLFVNDSVGAIDLAIDPIHPDTLFAATWQRTRRPDKRTYGGAGSGIWRSTDGGDSWTRLQNGLPQGANVGRIGLAVAPSSPNHVYAVVAKTNGTFGGVYHSDDSGSHWNLLFATDPGYSSYGWWFGQIRVDPNHHEHLFNMGIFWVESQDGGQNWSAPPGDFHADFHALCIHPTQPNYRILGNDGGIYVSTDGGFNWSHRPLPITQFNSSEIDYQYPDRFSGGAQDNGTLAGNTADQWTFIGGGDGFVTRVHPQNSGLFYQESQYGGFYGTNGAAAPLAERYNWNTPYLLDPSDPSTMYFGAERLFRSADGGLSWTDVSPDLSNGPGPSPEVVYGTITAIDVSPQDSTVLWAGTDDGNIWVRVDGQWNKVNTGLPRRWVTRLVADLWDAHTAYVCLSGFRNNESMAHIYRTDDAGQHWAPVAGDLPDVPVNDLILDPLNPAYWYAATDVGVFATVDAGAHWLPANQGMPQAPVTDLSFHPPSRTLLAATYGRSMYVCRAPLPSGSVVVQAPKLRLQASPNPFSDQIQCTIHLNRAQEGRLELWNMEGKVVQLLFNGRLSAGENTMTLPVKPLPAGYYWLHWSGPGAEKTGCKMVRAGW